MWLLFDCIALLGLVVVPVSFVVWLVLRFRKKPSSKRWKWIAGISLIVTVLCFAIGIPMTPEPTYSEKVEKSETKVEETIEQTTDVTEDVEPAPTEQTSKNAESPEVTNADDIDTSVTFAEIYREFKRNELNAKDLYNGNRYQITAKVNGMATGGLFNLTGGATLTMELQVDNTVVFFTAEFEKAQEGNLKQISVGDTITFIGTCYGGNFTDCELQ